jgi:hypothetical protein
VGPSWMSCRAGVGGDHDPRVTSSDSDGNQPRTVSRRCPDRAPTVLRRSRGRPWTFIPRRNRMPPVHINALTIGRSTLGSSTPWVPPGGNTRFMDVLQSFERIVAHP